MALCSIILHRDPEVSWYIPNSNPTSFTTPFPSSTLNPLPSSPFSVPIHVLVPHPLSIPLPTLIATVHFNCPLPPLTSASNFPSNLHYPLHSSTWYFNMTLPILTVNFSPPTPNINFHFLLQLSTPLAKSSSLPTSLYTWQFLFSLPISHFRFPYHTSIPFSTSTSHFHLNFPRLLPTSEIRIKSTDRTLTKNYSADK